MERELQIVIKKKFLDLVEAEYLFLADNASIAIAEKFRTELFQKIQEILPLYKRFPICKYRRPQNGNYRQMLYHSYLIIYKITKVNIEILYLFHTKQKPKKLTQMIKS